MCRPLRCTPSVGKLRALDLRIEPSGSAMMNRCLSLIVSVAAPISAAVMLFTGAHPVGAVTLSERMPCIGLALLALALAIVHARVAAGRVANNAFY